MNKRIAWLVAILAVVGIAAGAGWTYLRSRVVEEMDRALARLAGRGVVVVCNDRSVTGFPFRIEVGCATPSVVTPNGVRAEAKALRAVGLIYAPRLVIVELDGPLKATGPAGESVEATWTLLQTSIRIGSGGPERVSVAADGLDATATPAHAAPVHLVARHGEVHVRHAETAKGPFDPDVAASFAAATLTVGGKAVGPEKLDLSLDASVLGMPAPGTPAAAFAWAEAGGTLDLRSLRVATARDLAIEAKGSLAPRTDGLVDGRFAVTASGLETLASGGKLDAELAAVAAGFLLMGKPVETAGRKGRSLDLVIEAGKARLGRTPLGRLPPLWGNLNS